MTVQEQPRLTARTVVVSANADAVHQAALLLESSGITARAVPLGTGDLQAVSLRPVMHAGPLTSRQFEVLNLIARGMSNDEIGQQIGLSSTTVKTHLTRLYRRLGCDDRATAVLAGCRLGLIGEDQ